MKTTNLLMRWALMWALLFALYFTFMYQMPELAAIIFFILILLGSVGAKKN